MMSGPIIGQIFYSSFGFEGCFYCTSAVLAIALIISYYEIPNRVNKIKESDDETGGSGASIEIKVSYSDILKSRKAIMVIENISLSPMIKSLQSLHI